MRTLLLLGLLFFLNSCKAQDDTFFELKKISCGFLGNENVNGYKLTLKGYEDFPCSYNSSTFQRFNEEDKIKMCKELLRYIENDSLSGLKIICYNPLRSQIYNGNKKVYFIRLEALFLINQIIIDNPFNFSSFPLLYDNERNEIINGENEAEFKKIYKIYNEWVVKVELEGIGKINTNKIYPLGNSIYNWY